MKSKRYGANFIAKNRPRTFASFWENGWFTVCRKLSLGVPIKTLLIKKIDVSMPSSTQVKNTVTRGTFHEANTCDVIEQVEDEFEFAFIQTVSLSDLYGGKPYEAMDHQHPRDLFDVKILLQSRGIFREIFIGYLAYLLLYNQPISEVMSPRWKDIGYTCQKEFNSMIFEPITLEEL